MFNYLISPKHKQKEMIYLRKVLLIGILIFVVFVCTFPLSLDERELKTQLLQDKPPERSTEELYQDIFVTLLTPHINKAIEDYYGGQYGIAPYLVKVLSAERPNGYRTFTFRIKLKILPYTGPHNAIGEDHITFYIRYGSEVKMEKFEHIESYELPPYYH